MKFYFPQIPITKLKTDTVAKYLINTDIVSKLITTDGVMEIKADETFMCDIEDIPIVKTTISGMDVIIDHSKYEQSEVCFQIPVDHIFECINRKTYTLRKGSPVKMEIYEVNNKITDFYFLTKYDTNNIREDILTFLSILNLC